tara:strand:+ start:324 stop:539 length:216 start_codon:yes stop_codon:yes gene_type:complete
MLHEHSSSGDKIESKDGQRGCSCSNDTEKRCPSLDFNPQPRFASDSDALDYLANVLVKIFLSHHHVKNKTK